MPWRQQTGIETVYCRSSLNWRKKIVSTTIISYLINGVWEKRQNNGLVILLVTDQRCIQFYTSYGTEGVLPDAICKRIQTRYKIPYLKDGNWDTRMVAGLKRLASDSTVRWKMVLSPIRMTVVLLSFILAILCFIAIGGGPLSFGTQTRSLTDCGKHQLQKAEAESYPD